MDEHSIKTRLGSAITRFGCETKNGGGTCFGYFFKIGLCSATSFERSRRELSNDVAEHRYMLKNYQNTYYPRFSFILKTGIAFPKTGAVFTV